MIEWPLHYEVPTEAIFLPEVYQRIETRDESRIRKYVREFNPLLFGELKVSERDDGTYACIDGGHRLEAAIRKKIAHVPAEVLSGLSEKDEAELCLLHNTERRGFSAFDRWKIELLLERPDAVVLARVLKRRDVRVIPSSAGTRSGRSLRAITALRYAYRLTDEDAVDKALATLAKIWEGKHFTGDLIKVLALFHHRYPQVASDELAASVARVTPERLEAEIRAARKVVGGAGGEQRAVDLIVQLYNRGRRDKLEPYRREQ